MSALPLDPISRSAHAHALAGCFFSLLDWWTDKGMKADPKEMDDLFHRMAWRGLVNQKGENRQALRIVEDDRKNAKA